MLIPRLVTHVWPGRDPFRPEFHAWRASWMRHNPDWSFAFHRLEETGDDRVDELLANPKYTVVVKSDILRLQLLYRFGGVYADTDCECLKSFEPLRETQTGFWASVLHQVEPIVMGAVAGHAFVKTYLDAALDALAAVTPAHANKMTSTVTGPLLMDRLAKGRRDVTLLPREWFYVDNAPNAYARHHYNGATSKLGWVKQLNARSDPPTVEAWRALFGQPDETPTPPLSIAVPSAPDPFATISPRERGGAWKHKR